MVNPHNRIFCRLDGLTPTTREQRRLTALERWGLLDPDSAPVFEEATQTIARVLKTPIAILGLLVKDKLWLKSSVGLSSIGLMNQLAASRAIPRNEAFSTYVVDSEQHLAIEDAATDPVFANSILFQHYGIRGYLGVPFVTSDGQCLGALAVMDLEPRQFSDRDIDYLLLTARWCSSEFERNRFLSERRDNNMPGQTPLMEHLSGLPFISQYQRALKTNSLAGEPSMLAADTETINPTDTLKVRLLTQLTEELRTPLTSVMGMARILSQEVYGALTLKQKEYVEIIHDSGQHLLALVEEIINLGASTAEEANLQLAPVDIEMLCQQALNNLYQIAKQERQRLRLSVEPGPRLWLLDKEKVRQALYYLVYTVIQSAESGSEIRIHVSRKEGNLNVSVWVSHPWLGDGLPQVEMYSQPLNLEISPSWDISDRASESAMLESSLSQQILTDSSLSPLEKVEQLKEKSVEESYREILGLVLSCHLAELHGGSIAIQGSLQSGYRYIFRLPKIETHEN
ncbi:MAG: GAF domain-containing sensor histidine kinase [Cyanobacteriota bacterium]|nr:GAF domain-containing sensor histidine kinase [Cyanobacteriota bacterium]